MRKAARDEIIPIMNTEEDVDQAEWEDFVNINGNENMTYFIRE